MKSNYISTISVIGTTKTIVGLLTIVNLLGCASVPSSSNNPIAPIAIDCRYATSMSAELERIISNPSVSYTIWDRTFANLSGHQTAQQRISSAKTVLWTIRLKCPGF
jgi:hypothetical protein